MNAKDYWILFRDTGAPEAYLAYKNALKMEDDHVFDHQGTGPESNGLL